ncbi:cupin-like domain-containing protein [Microbulbifer sp.]|uniref:cupin-like domain-containing protein n=1 Tax=Microbulbifer sp. TaxID=1908541 RepID=UPI00258C8E3F|nr:cupin-like domain-containing protein [Microbulbifer sp.]
MALIARKTRIIEGVEPHNIPFEELVAEGKPAVIKGVASDWPLACVDSPQQAASYLKSYYRGRRVTAFTARPELRGRFGYTDDATQLDFDSDQGDLGEYLDRILAHIDDPAAPSFYIGSTDVDLFLPGFRAENDLMLDHDMFTANPPMVSVWIGNRTTALAHHDLSHNMACCLIGRRRFTLFPPEQVANLYPGPLEPTPGGQVVTMANISAPDFERFPGLREALDAGEVAELEPGDVLYFPAMWWHQVDALDTFNVMVNYWWNLVPDFMDTPQNTLLHALLSLRDRPEAEKRAWRAMFDYYVFGPAERAGEHLPETARGNLAPLDEFKARRLRALLLRRLNR